MTREEVYLAMVEGWLRNNRSIVFTEGAVDDLCDRIAAENKRLTSERNDYEAEGRRHIKTIAELRFEIERLRGEVSILRELHEYDRKFIAELRVNR